MLNKIINFLELDLRRKVSDISKFLHVSRREVSLILNANPSVFYKEETGNWVLVKPLGAAPELKIEPLKNKEANYEDSGNKDGCLLERIHIELNKKPKQKVSDLAKNLGVHRAFTKKTLLLNLDCFYEDDFHEWAVIGTLDVIYDSDIDISPSPIIKNMGRINCSVKKIPAIKAIIEASLDRNLLVLAPPGTGKTHTLIERLIYSITNADKTTDAVNLLVLSFTRTAVGEIRERIARAIADGAPNNLRYVQVKTFDAYATWLLNDGDYDITGKDYDSRIKLLTKELKKNSLKQNTARIENCRYLFVDEIQDLVSVRADMVFELMKRIISNKGAITLLGDPHQSLNDYQIKDGQTDSLGFLEKVKNHLSGSLEQFELEESHRYDTPEMKVLAEDAKKILDASTQTAREKFKALVSLIPEISQEQLVARFLNKEIDALLCRSNSEVFQWLSWHQEQGNTCTVYAGAVGRPWPAWIGEAVMHYQRKVMTYEQLVGRVHSNAEASITPSEREFDEFLSCERLLRHNVINLDDLAFRLKYLSPSVQGDSSEKGLKVSTVHKAKGLEYKNVVAIQPNQRNITDEEVRVLYVAITRAKRSIFLLPKNQIPFTGYMKRGHGGHYRYSQNGTKFNQILGLEDFDLETLFISKNGGVDQESLGKYLASRRKNKRFIIKPVSRITELDLNYALFMISGNEPVKICSISEPLQKDINAMSLKKENDSWVSAYGAEGAMIDLGYIDDWQTIAHPMESPILTRHIGPAGIMLFPLIQGFYPLSRATGE